MVVLIPLNVHNLSQKCNMFFIELLFILEKCKRQAAGDDQTKEDTNVISMITCLNVSCHAKELGLSTMVFLKY